MYLLMITYFIKVLHLFSVCKPGFLVLTGLNDKHFIICKHLCEAVGKNFPYLNVQLVNLEFFFITLNFKILFATGLFSYLQLKK